MAYIIAEPCIGVKDASCVDACPVDCIHPKKNTNYEDGRPGFDDVSQLYIDPVECIDCGACVPVCPVSAIFPLEDLPEKWKQYAELNTSYMQGGKFTSDNTPSMLGSKPAFDHLWRVTTLTLSVARWITIPRGNVCDGRSQAAYNAIQIQ